MDTTLFSQSEETLSREEHLFYGENSSEDEKNNPQLEDLNPSAAIEKAEQAIMFIANNPWGFYSDDIKLFRDYRLDVGEALDDIEDYTVAAMRKAEILLFLPVNLLLRVLMFAGECVFSGFNDYYIYFANEYDVQRFLTREWEEREERSGPREKHCPEKENVLAEIAQAEQYSMWADQRPKRSNGFVYLSAEATELQLLHGKSDKYKKVICTIENDESFMNDIASLPCVLFRIVASFLTEYPFCSYKAQLDYFTREYWNCMDSLHYMYQTNTGRHILGERNSRLYSYREHMENVTAMKQSIAYDMPHLNRRLTDSKKTIAELVIRFLPLSDFVSEPEYVYETHGEIEYEHRWLVENELYVNGHENIMSKRTDEITRFLRSVKEDHFDPL